ncbi:MAG: MBL fold metallo-hydrolase [Bacteroidales bacterium]|nr:MBL fold metallo-hydrolase [Bacteroidales bacterium]
MEIFRFIFNPISVNTYVVSGKDGRCVVIDPGCLDGEEREALASSMREKGLTPDAVLLTHGHMDHIYGAAWMQEAYGTPIYMACEDIPVIGYFQRIAKFGLPAADPNFTTTGIKDSDVLEAAGLEFKVIGTPGHSPGSVCYLSSDERTMFTGDTLFAGAIGRTDLYLGEYDDEIRSIMNKLMALDGDIAIYPGHGGPSTIGRERTTNPFLEPFNEREEIPELNPNPYDEN